MRAVVDHVAALAQALEIAQPVVAGVMVEMRCRQDHAGLPDLQRFHEIGPSGRPAAAVAPGAASGVEPASVGQTANRHAMRPAAYLATHGLPHIYR